MQCQGCSESLAGRRCPKCGAAAVAGPYSIERIVARHEHGRLYAARDGAGRKVALKELVFASALSAGQVEAFERQGRLLAQLSHPGIPAFVRSFREGEGIGERLYIAHDFVEGESLLDRLGTHRFDEAEALDIARQVLAALVYLHAQTPPVLHRDIKPANLIRRADGTVVLIDFGSAREVAGGKLWDGTVTGTFGYIPVEQLGGIVDETSDLYALGSTLVHLLGRTPPQQRLTGDFAIRLGDELNLSARGRAFLRRLIEAKREKRFPSAADASAFLSRPATSRIGAWVAGALAGAAAVGVGAYHLANREPSVVRDVSESRLRGSPAAPTTSRSSPAMVAHWSFDEPENSAILADSAGTIPAERAGPISVPGVFGRALQFSGDKDQVIVFPARQLEARIDAQGAFAFWVRLEGVVAWLLCFDGGRNGPPPLLLSLETARLRASFHERSIDAPVDTKGGFHHLALNWGPGTAELYWDGARVASGNDLPRIDGYWYPRFGGGKCAPRDAQGSRMTLDEVTFYQDQLPSEDVAALFRKGIAQAAVLTPPRNQAQHPGRVVLSEAFDTLDGFQITTRPGFPYLSVSSGETRESSDKTLFFWGVVPEDHPLDPVKVGRASKDVSIDAGKAVWLGFDVNTVLDATERGGAFVEVRGRVASGDEKAVRVVFSNGGSANTLPPLAQVEKRAALGGQWMRDQRFEMITWFREAGLGELTHVSNIALGAYGVSVNTRFDNLWVSTE